MTPKHEATKQLNEAVSACQQAGMRMGATKMYPSHQWMIVLPMEVIYDSENHVLYYDGVETGSSKKDS